MALPHHKNDLGQLPDEPKVIEAMRAAGVQPDAYFFPYAKDQAALNEPDHVAEMERHRHRVAERAATNGQNLAIQFIYFLGVSILVAYIGAATLAEGTEYLAVFQVVGTAAILAYAGALISGSVWWGRPWSNTFKDIFDGVLYGLLTAGVFGWLWPR